MTKLRSPIAASGAACDETEALFYEALRHADLDLLLGCWADDDDVVCVHPGGSRLTGIAAIRASFEALFAQGGLRIHPERVRVLQTVACEVHHVMERIELPAGSGDQTAYALATNVYFKTAQGWRLVLHHAAPAPAEGGGETGEMPSVLH